MKAEEWRKVESFPGYSVSTHGRVRRDTSSNSTYSGRILRQNQNFRGYLRTCLSSPQKSRTVFVHRLVAAAFVPNPLGKPTVNHIDGDKLNNNASNLEWATFKENDTHARNLGLIVTAGEQHPRAVLSEADVIEIRASAMSASKLAAKYGVSKRTINSVIAGETWRHLLRRGA